MNGMMAGRGMARAACYFGDTGAVSGNNFGIESVVKIATGTYTVTMVDRTLSTFSVEATPSSQNAYSIVIGTAPQNPKVNFGPTKLPVKLPAGTLA